MTQALVSALHCAGAPVLRRVAQLCSTMCMRAKVGFGVLVMLGITRVLAIPRRVLMNLRHRALPFRTEGVAQDVTKAVEHFQTAANGACTCSCTRVPGAVRR